MPKTKKPSSHKKPTKSNSRSYKKPLIIVMIILLILCLLPWFFKYEYYRYVKCGQEPVKVVQGAIGSSYGYYITPSSMYYSDEVLVYRYYCSELDAQAAGFPSGYLPDGSRTGDTHPLQ